MRILKDLFILFLLWVIGLNSFISEMLTLRADRGILASGIHIPNLLKLCNEIT